MVKAFIFDMDGVLIDSMPYHADAWKAVFNKVGISITRQDMYDIEGSNHDGVIRLMYGKEGRTPHSGEMEKLAREKRGIFKEISEIKVFEGINECLELLKDRYLLGVVSGSDRATVHEIIDRHFPGIFSAVVAGEDVHKGKPDPEPYLRAVQMLDVRKKDCIVIENAPLGVESAKRAGLYCVAIPTYVKPYRLQKADMVLENHAALVKYLGELAADEQTKTI